MNALTRATTSTISRTVVSQQRRMKSAYAPPSFSKTWLSDPSTYPIFGVIGLALAGCTSFMTYKITCDKSVRITSKAKGKVIRTW